MSTYHADITAQIFHKQVAPWVLDKSWEDFNDIENLVLEKEHKFPGSYLLRAIAGLDTSLWDLKGKLENKPVTELIGGNKGSLKVYGLQNIRVVDASIMPTMLSANLHSGATLIGEKGSDLVLGKEPLETINLNY